MECKICSQVHDRADGIPIGRFRPEGLLATCRTSGVAGFAKAGAENFCSLTMDCEAVDLAHGVEARFRRIEETMAGMPMPGEALRVEVVGMMRFDADWICVLITPWFMNLMLLLQGRLESPAPSGVKSIAMLPGGRFVFMQWHNEIRGPFRLCSLFSPVFDFPGHDSAVATVRYVRFFALGAEDAGDEDRTMIDIREDRKPEPDAVPMAENRDKAVLSRRRLFGLGGAEKSSP